ncbi:DUF2332 domain-containing protein [Roseomonas sp. JC162]|uniref:DUF2332 domain-containing protein n=1 Tax=Neoroseomonas marina TaxID=1232220 RepID=A0A848EJZ1_9PROT|nr:DUF2332 domain-containing protein [Neoroseomonas marina]
MTREDAIADRYRRFAAEEARGRSPLYAAITEAIAADAAVLAHIATLPEAKQQPNLVLAAVRHRHGVASGWPQFRAWFLEDFAGIREIILARSTQTNEPGRCAVLLPVLTRLQQPLALIEVGASAGLCLLPDRYGYDYGRARLGPSDPAAPVFPCKADAATPLPDRSPQVVWRAGLDLNPLDAADPETADWLMTLVWPEQQARAERLRAALAIASTARPPIVKGDLRSDLVALAAQAPKGATLVVFHTAVLSYVAEAAERQAFAVEARRIAPIWIANEAPSVLPERAQGLGAPPVPGRFLLSVNGAPVAWTDPHGAAMEWLEGTG